MRVVEGSWACRVLPTRRHGAILHGMMITIPLLESHKSMRLSRQIQGAFPWLTNELLVRLPVLDERAVKPSRATEL